jgi:Spy/CpxP family protein refolding chaperone
MKSKTLTLVVLTATGCLATPLARAQAVEDPAPFHHRHHGPFDLNAMLTRTLNLTDAQQAQVKPLVAEVQPQLDAIHQQAHQSANLVLKQLDAKVRPLLTPEQQKRLDAFATLRETRSSEAEGDQGSQ